jgi:hypothetical protein
MCCLWTMEKISWNDGMKNQELIHRVKEEKNILHKIKWWKANWMRHILRRYWLVKYIIEGQIEGTERRGRRLKQPRDGMKERKKILALESRTSRSHCVENSLWMGLEHVARNTASCTEYRTESQETWTSPGKRASRLTQVIIALLGLLHP